MVGLYQIRRYFASGRGTFPRRVFLQRGTVEDDAARVVLLAAFTHGREHLCRAPARQQLPRAQRDVPPAAERPRPVRHEHDAPPRRAPTEGDAQMPQRPVRRREPCILCGDAVFRRADELRRALTLHAVDRPVAEVHRHIPPRPAADSEHHRRRAEIGLRRAAQAAQPPQLPPQQLRQFILDLVRVDIGREERQPPPPDIVPDHRERRLRALQTEARAGLPVGEPVKGQLPAHAAQRRVLTHLPRAHMPRAGHARRLHAV